MTNKKFILIIIFILIINIFLDCEEKKIVLMDDLKGKIANYDVGKIVEGDYIFLQYSNNKKLITIPTKGYLGGSQLIYYKNSDDKYKLYSILINGKYYGDPNKEFIFEILDLDYKQIYVSKKYKYSMFEKNKTILVELIIEDNNIKTENGFFIRVLSFPNKTGGIIISEYRSKTSYSYKYFTPTLSYERPFKNWEIFIKLKKG